MRRLLPLLLLALAPACDDGAAPSAGDAGDGVCLSADCLPDCREDRDCAGALVCREARCVSEAPFGPDAAAPACARNGDCPAGEACDGDTRRCVPDVRPCADRADCFADEICAEGVCAPRAAEPDAGAAPDAAIADAAAPDGGPADAAPPDADAEDAAPLDAQPLDAEIDAQPLDAGTDAAEPPPPDMFVPPPTPPRGTYTYRRLPIGGLRNVQRVAFHPDGTYALTVDAAGAVHVYDWATEVATPLAPARGVAWTDVAFAPDGGRAVLTGATTDDGEPTAVIYVFDDAAWRAEAPEAALALAPAASVAGQTPVAVKYDPDTGEPWVLLARRNRPGYTATLRPLDPAAGTWGEAILATATRYGASDFDFVRDEFGGPAKLVVCGQNGGATYLHTTLGGVPEWRENPGTRNLGNLGSVARHPSGAYALIVSWSGRRIMRYQGGVVQAGGPNYSRQGIYRVAFQPDGRRALVVGRAGVQPARGTVVEFRHDAWRCPNAYGDCDLTEVSIPDFDAAPYNADSNVYLNDAAFRPGCDGGLVVGGGGDLGLLIRFDIAGGVACP